MSEYRPVGKPDSRRTVDMQKAQRTGARMANGCVIGLMGGFLGGWMMNVFTRVVSTVTHGNEANGVAPGARRVGRGMQPPQAQVDAENDAAVRIGKFGYRAVTGRRPNRALALRLGTTAHYGFSAALGVCYVLLVRRAPSFAQGHGLLYGSLVWLLADEGLMPALGLSRGPRQLSPGMHFYSLMGHWVYGATLESTRQLVR
jgi:uncharacterized membrane protein YagU involved in acid resistance